MLRREDRREALERTDEATEAKSIVGCESDRDDRQRCNESDRAQRESIQRGAAQRAHHHAVDEGR